MDTLLVLEFDMTFVSFYLLSNLNLNSPAVDGRRVSRSVEDT